MARGKINNAQKVRDISNKAKAVGKELNKYSNLLDMVPYSKPAIRGANYGVKALDSLATLMDHFSLSGSPAIAGGPMSGMAGVANNVQVRRSAPKFQNTQGTVRIIHKELVTQMSTSSSVAVTPIAASSGASVYQVNASCGTSFPWLAQIAANYDYYRFKRLRLVYVPLCATTETGRVSLVYDPDSSDPIPFDRQALSSYSCSTEGAVWATQTLDCKLSDVTKWYYNDGNAVGTNSATATNALLDQGQFFGAVYAGTGSNSLGEIYALYDVELKDPQPNAGTLFQAFGDGASPSGNFPTNFPIFNNTGTATTVVITIASPGRWFISLSCATSGTVPLVAAGSGGVVLASNSAGSGAVAQMAALLRVDTAPATFTFSGLTGLGAWTLYATRLPYYPVTFH